MKKISKWIIIFIGIMCISLIVFWYLKDNNYKNLDNVDIDNYLIHYYIDDDVIYDMETKENGIFITERGIRLCIDAPCDPITITNYIVKYQKRYVDFIKDLFKNKDSKEITIRRENLNNEQMKILTKIVDTQ